MLLMPDQPADKPPGGPPRDACHPAADCVHVFRVAADPGIPLVEHWQHVLAPEEQARAARFHRQADRDRFVIGRALTRLTLGATTGLSPTALVIRQDPLGKPFLECPDGQRINAFNVSHSGAHVLLAMAADRLIGIDVEQISPEVEIDLLVARFFSARERIAFGALPPAVRRQAFFRGWCRKESYVKALGQGLEFPMDGFDVSLTPDASPVLLEDRSPEGAATVWCIRDLWLDANHMAAISASGPPFRLRMWMLGTEGWNETNAASGRIIYRR